VTLIAGQVPARALHRVAETLARHRFNIDEIQRLSEGHFGCVELLVSNLNPVDLAELKRELLALSREVGVDIAFQSEGLYRRAKRMIVFDLDSTLIHSEGIDELARELGRQDEVSAVTHAAMQGGMDYDESLRLRVEKLRGLTEAQIDAVYSRIELTPGAEELIRALRALGYRTALISGGFGCLAERIRSRLGIDRAFANELEMSQGRATGQVRLPIVNAHRKAELLEELARAEGIPLDQVIAVGDGANDLLMLEKAGLGIAFKAKPVLRQSADCALEQSSLSSILYLLGLSGRELQELLP
jgi:phosphoserine phosphatase